MADYHYPSIYRSTEQGLLAADYASGYRFEEGKFKVYPQTLGFTAFSPTYGPEVALVGIGVEDLIDIDPDTDIDTE